MMNGMFNGMFGKIAQGMCRLSINGGIAIKTSNGYKTYEVASGQLTNCDNFVFNIGEEFFFVVPTNRVKPGDIILANGKPKCVIEASKNRITAINYEDSTLEQILTARHVFLGNVYFYGKIVSMFGNNLKKGKGPGKIMKYMMFSEMMKGNGGNGNGGGMMSNLLPLMFLGKGNMDFLDDFGDFGDAFDMDDDEDDDDDKQ